MFPVARRRPAPRIVPQLNNLQHEETHFAVRALEFNKCPFDGAQKEYDSIILERRLPRSGFAIPCRNFCIAL